ncbi:MAG: SAM-dependent methyltransferase [Bacteroidales bacterium]|jgi:16S rRNA (cytidine1402-2'-O)-methyltransferase|nr:SAM-dependent methyltransferase [Bacteroidales bacterium]
MMTKENMEGKRGRLFLIPSPLGENDPAEVIPAPVLKSLEGFRTFVVEEVRTARRYLSKAGLKGHIGELEFHELNEHTEQAEIEGYIRLFDNGNDVALISEAGLPAVADPGAQLVALAHRNGIEVIPAVGPSSLMLALMASGLNGQSFAFCGYIPAKTDERRSRLKTLEKVSGQLHQTQILIETPYRNDSLFADILAVCSPSVKVCVAANITMPDAYIRTMSVSQWKKQGIVIGKRPCVFLILA